MLKTVTFSTQVFIALLAGSVAQAQALLTRQPARNAVAAPRSGPVSLTFAQPIGTAAAAGLRIDGSQLRGKRPGTLSGGGTATLSFAPSQDFAPGERVTVTVPSSVASKQLYQFTAATGGPGRGFFLDTTEVTYTSSRDQLLGDIDNDGDLDLLTSAGLYGMYSFLNDGTGHFTNYRNTVVGDPPSGATLADVNGDGYLDLLAGDGANPTVGIALNNGNGIFGLNAFPAQLLIVGGPPVSVAAGDVDADGDVDFVSASSTANSVTIGFNNGTGYFSSVTTLAAGTRPSAVQLGDLDNDGDLDMMISSQGGNYVLIKINNGLGTFSNGASIGAGTAPTDLQLADIDHDGDLDLLVANAGNSASSINGSVSVRTNNGTGTFSGTTTLTLPLGSSPTGLSTGDVDADGDLDLVVAQGAGGQIITFINNGSGSFLAQYSPLQLQATSQGPAITLGVTLGDVDGDGDLDVITAEGNTYRVVLGRDGLAPPVPAPVIISFSPGAGPAGSTVSISGTALASTSAVSFNGTTASFTVGAGQQLTATVPAGASTGPIQVTTAGGTALSAQPFVVTTGSVAPVSVLSTTPASNALGVSATAAVSATFGAPVSTLSAGALRVFGSQRGARAGAVSGGGTATLSLTPSPAFLPGERVSLTLPATLTGTAGGVVQPRVVEFRAASGGTGEGVFDAAGRTTTTLPQSATNWRAADFDNDGDLDLVGQQSGATPVVLLFNNGSGTFTVGTAVLPAVPGTLAEVTPADVDGDGDLDLLVALSLAGQNQTRLDTWLNNGSGRFLAGPQLTGLTGYRLPQAGDLDRDGDLDVLYMDNYVARVALNNGTGTYAVSGAAATVGNTYQTQLADLDNDGDLDLVALTDSQLFSVLNNGLGGLQTPVGQPAGGYYSVDLKVGDLTGDGLPDAAVLTAGYVSNGPGPGLLAIWPGLPTGQFGSRGVTYTVGDYPRALQLHDLNADGRLDVLTLTGGSTALPGRLDVLLGDGQGRLQLPTTTTIAAVNQFIASPELADFDGDGDLDLAFANTALPALVLHRNQGIGVPTIAALAPAQGPVGTRVVLSGTNLRSARQVTFGGVAAASVVVLSATQCAAVVPAGAVTGPVVVTTAGGTASSPGSFTVTVPVLPSGRTPARNAVSVPVNSSVGLTFAQSLPANAAGNLIVNSNLRQGRRLGTASGVGTARRDFDPTLDFAPGEQVQVTLPAGTGVNAAAAEVYEFTAATSGSGRGQLLRDSYLSGIFAERLVQLVGDFDEDGSPDLMMDGGVSNVVRVQLNDGQGRFGSRVTTVPVALLRAVQAVDFNGDSHLDLLMSVYYSGGLQEIDQLVWRAGTGTGSFGPEQLLYTSPSIGMMPVLAAGDLNGDGLPDVTALTPSADSVLVLLNDGAGGVRRRPSAAAVPGTKALRLADLDNDGRLDLVTLGTALLGYGYGTGSGDFVSAAPAMLPDAGFALEVGDVNGDGNLDLLTSSQSRLRLYQGDGAGNFTVSQLLSLTNGPVGVRLADFDGDGDLDLLVNDATRYSGARVLRNDGAGAFTAPPLSLAANTVAQVLNIADFNLDGSLDLSIGGDSLINSTGFVTKQGTFMYLNRPLVPSIASFTPANGPAGTVITLIGSSLGTVTSVTIGGVSVAFTVVSATQLTITTGPGTATGPIVLTSPSGSGSSSSPFTVPVPTIASFTPGSGAVQRLVTLTGTYFGGTTGVRFNGVAAPGFVVVSGTELTVPVPPGATSGPLTLTTPSGTATSSTSFTVLPNPTMLSLNPARNAVAAPVGGNLQFTYSAPVDATSAAGLRVFSRQRGRQPGTVSATGATLSFAPTVPFGAGEEVSVSVPASVRDVNGDPVLAGQVYQFRSATGGAGRGLFVQRQVVTPVGFTVTYETLTGDFNGDGFLDLLTREQNANGTGPMMARLTLNEGTGRLTTTSQLTLTQPGCQQLATADVDNDGDLDVLALSSSTANAGLEVLLNNGQGQFAAGPPVEEGPSATKMTVGDVNGDGNLDVLISQLSWSVVATRLGDGQGGFRPGPDVSVLDYPTNLSLGDLDNDGDLDLVVSSRANSSSRYASVRFNDGRGQFSGTQQISFGQSTVDNVALGDFDNDGDLDLLIEDASTGASIWANDGTGQFATALNPWISGAWYTSAILLGDVDADGDLDVLLNNQNYTITTARLLLNRGNGAFTVVALPMGLNQFDATLGDIDGDGDLDLLAAVGANVEVWRNGPTQAPVQLTAQAPARNAGAASFGTAVDLTFSQPIAAASATGWAVTSNLRQGRRSGTYAGGGTTGLRFVPSVPFAPGEQVSVTVPATLAAAGGTPVRAEVYQFTAATAGNGTGIFSPPTGVPAALPGQSTEWNTAVADVNGDGALDVLSLVDGLNPSSKLEVRLSTNTGRATFGPLQSLSISSASVMTVGDVDNDGDLDVVTGGAGSTSRMLQVLLNDGTGTFSPGPSFVGRGAHYALRLADLNADGNLDLVATAYLALTIYFGNGQGDFMQQPQLNLQQHQQDVFGLAAGDLDQDGSLDLVYTNAYNGYISLWYNFNNTPALSPQEYDIYLNGTASVMDVKLADMDADGDLDLVVLNRDVNTFVGEVLIYRNDGVQRFVLARSIPVDNYAAQLQVGDLDHDGDTDVAVLIPSTGAINLRFHPGTLSQPFGLPAVPLNLGNPTSQFTLADLDRDGDLDLVAASGYSLLLRLNGGTGLSTRGPAVAGPALHLYPNPASSRHEVQLEAGIGAEAATVQVYNTLGQLLRTQALPAAARGRAALPLTGLAPGTYVVQLRTAAGQQLSQRLVVE